ncbi:complement factor B-like isoform X2 [Thalassophryne amazonica]|uniref:complement factor B-like isoform X2 n=1 Tax=Thalassophryne amazonica TaxID=390379 RepID=UPI001471ABB7|nr:complement factor B-like isoform X2 [Thalassophryne amazonica]
MNRFNMRFSLRWSWFAALSVLLFMGAEVWCDCPDELLGIEGGDYTLTKTMEPGSILIYHCPEEYYPYPDLVRVCQLTGKWNPTPKKFRPQRCRLVECPDPTVLLNGNVVPSQEKYFVNNVTTYECYSGYTLYGSSRRVCLPNGKWSGPTPICSRGSGDHCADPGIPAGASRNGNQFGIDDKVKYMCNSNLNLVGPSERVCQENGQWTGTEPACYYKHTFDTPLEVAKAFGSSITETLTTLEPVDDTQEGRKIRLTKNGTLNIYIAVDVSESITKDDFISARNAVLKLITKIASFSVTPNYEIVFFAAEIFEIVNIIDFLDNKQELHRIKTALETFTVGEKELTGTDLNLVFRKMLEQIAVIKQRAGETFKDYHHVIIVFTDGAYNMGGSPAQTVAAIKQMVYMNPTGGEDTNKRDEYLDIYIFGIGGEIFDDDLNQLTVGTGGQHFFKLKDLVQLQETFDEIIDEEEVKGLCGLHRDYESQGNRKLHPWIAEIRVQNEGSSQKCLGSLVTPKFVLTAAHCFRFGDLPKHVTVDIDDGQGRVKRVQNFTLHPKYNVNAQKANNVDEFYDYDVALIELVEYVQISTDVRPICIPCTQETSAALKIVRDTTCKQQEQLLLNKQNEPLMFLTKSRGQMEKKDVNAKLGDNRKECISHALKAKGIRTQNVSLVVTDNFLCTGGLFPQRDHIACTGDSGGAVFKNYEHRTIQVALVSWGTKNLCQSGGLVESDADSRDFHINLFRMVPFLKSVLGNDQQDDFVPLQFLEN